ncbi:MAG: hypothetical protein HY232_18160 [Acidobacteria bacterium]|nr:hypothetical protein [Acidobacteriota bacterium]
MHKHLSVRHLAFVPIITSMILSARFFITLPIHDYWYALISSVALQQAGWRAHLAYYWEPFVDQRMVFPKIMIGGLSRLPYTLHFALEIAFGFAARLAMLYLLWRLIRQTEGSERNKTIAGLACAFLLFWPLQQVIFQHHWYSTQYAWSLSPGVLALYLIDRFWGRWLGLLAAALACAVGSFSHGTGLPLWPAIGLGLLPQRGWSDKQKVVWWLLGLCALALFLIGLPPRAVRGFPPLLDILNAPLKGLVFFFQTFAPPFRWLMKHPYARAAVGTGVVIGGLLPLARLWKNKRLFVPATFPWLVLILWCLGMAGLAALARSTFEYHARPIYFAGMTLSYVGAISLWLIAAPRLDADRGQALPSRRRMTGSLVLICLTLIYLKGANEGWNETRDRYQKVSWAQSCLQYYPALDQHDLYVYPYEDHRAFTEFILPQLAAMNALPDNMRAAPFTIPVPTTFVPERQEGLDIRAAGPSAFQITFAVKDPLVVFKSSPPIPKPCVVSFELSSSVATDVIFSWNDGTGWSKAKAVPMDRKGRPVTKHSGYFPEGRQADRARPVEAIRLKLTKAEGSPITVTIQDLKVWIR